MNSDTSLLPDLVKRLMQLNGLNPAQLADRANISRPNLYNWLNGKSQSLSVTLQERMLEALGVSGMALSGQVAHRWCIEPDLDSLRLTLQALVEEGRLQRAEIYFVSTGRKQAFNLIRVPGEGQDITLLIASDSRLASGFPLSARKLGLGIDMTKVDIPDVSWKKWWAATPILPSREFWVGAAPYFRNIASGELMPTCPEEFIDAKAEFERQIIEKTAENAGLRAIIRALLSQVRSLDPENEMLDHDKRHGVYSAFYEQELEKLKGHGEK